MKEKSRGEEMMEDEEETFKKSIKLTRTNRKTKKKDEGTKQHN